MSSLTEIREALEVTLAALPERVSVTSTGGSYDDQSEKFTVRILVGPPGPKSEARVDALLAPDGAKAMLEADLTLGGLVNALHVPSHAGYRAFERRGEPTQLGTELVVQLYR